MVTVFNALENVFNVICSKCQPVERVDNKTNPLLKAFENRKKIQDLSVLHVIG